MLVTAWLALACGDTATGGDTQTNWLKMCQVSAECADLECICGVCTRPCETGDCRAMGARAICVPAAQQAAQDVCGENQARALCLAACDEATPCARGERCLAGACAPKPAAPAAPDDPSGFCQLWLDSFAAYTETCGCGADAAARYREQNASLCAEGGPFNLASAVEQGSLRYDAAAAQALFARLAADPPLCVEEPFRDLGLDSLEVYSLGGVFTGTRALGEPCSLPVGYKGGVSDCAEGVCASDGVEAGVCIAFVGRDQECDASGDENLVSSSARLCHETRAVDNDGEYESAFDALSCAAPTAGGASVCRRALDDGELCPSPEACKSGRCDGILPEPRTCKPKLAAGAACDTSSDCATGACRYDLTPSVCGALLPNGTACWSENAACVSGSCRGGQIAGAFTEYYCAAPATAAIGDACLVDEDCTTGTCRGGLCFADVCGHYLDP
jgi:hypothetical protein